MSSHRRRVKHFDRKSGPRKALFRGLVESLVEHGRITTTVDRAKEARRHAEKAITLGKKGDLNTTRLLLSRYPNKAVVSAIMKDIAPRFKNRPGGYTRIIKIGRRPGDTAEMAFLEFVDYDFKTAKAAATPAKATKAAKGAKADKSVEKAASKAKKASAVAVKTAKKSVRKMQNKSRQASQANAR